MARRGWFGLPFFDSQTEPSTTACVLSGGGARASFQIGALDYLYANDPGFAPTIFVGASAGAILAAGLAQYPTRQEQIGFLKRVDELWCSMTGPEDMFTPRPWLSRLLAEAPAWLELVGQGAKPADAPSRSSWLPLRRRRPEPPGTETPEDPVEEALTPDEELQSDFSLGLMAQLAGALGRLPKLGSDLMAVKAGMEQSRSLYRPGPVLAKLLHPDVFDPDRVSASGMQLRMAMVALETGELHFMREDGALVNREDREIDAGPHNLTRGVLASCAIPGVFRPVPVGAETYVDGGARENLPAEMAIGHLQVGRTYVVSSQTDGVPRKQSMAQADIFQVVMRATEILMDESGRDETAYALSAGAVVIAPDIEVHEAMTVHPGLIRIHRDHGWSRAAAVVEGIDAAEQQRLSRVTALRMRCLRREEAWLDDLTNRRALLELQSAKLELRDAMARCQKNLLPEGVDQCWARFEEHPRNPGVEPRWLEG